MYQSDRDFRERQNPSLKPLLRDAEFISKAYERARTKAALETNKDESVFPEHCPFDETAFGWPTMQIKGS
jgi:hypothetical protein